MLSAVEISSNVLLSGFTRFGIGGPADAFIRTASETAFLKALKELRAGGAPFLVIGGGTNLIVSDEGFRGTVLQYSGDNVHSDGRNVVAESGAVLQALVDYTVDRGLKGLETLAGIPGWVGAAVYGNAGAYGHSISERVRQVRFTDGVQLRCLRSEDCEFRYRESIFKRNKDWVIFSVELEMEAAPAAELRTISGDILKVRNEKFPPTMKCAGSIFKNLLAAELPENVLSRVPQKVIREGKIPAAYFLDQAGAKGLRNGGIQVAEYHANLLFNAGGGSASELCALIDDLKARVRAEFGLELEEEVQYVGF